MQHPGHRGHQGGAALGRTSTCTGSTPAPVGSPTWATRSRSPTRASSTARCASRISSKNQIVWLPYAPFNNTYALAANADTVAKYGGISTLSDLARVNDAGDLPGLCVESEFSVRNDGLPGMSETYGTAFGSDQISELATGAIYQATGNGQCEFGEVFTTDGRIVEFDLTVLEDDLSFFPKYNPSPNVRASVLDE